VAARCGYSGHAEAGIHVSTNEPAKRKQSALQADCASGLSTRGSCAPDNLVNPKATYAHPVGQNIAKKAISAAFAFRPLFDWRRPSWSGARMGTGTELGFRC